MNARQVHALIAAGVNDPRLIDYWEKYPEILRDEGLVPERMDLRSLRYFVGLVVKVRHNGIRADLPLTFRLLSVVGSEIELFSAYARHCASIGHVFASTPQGRTRDLIAFLERWVDLSQKNGILLWDIARHEYALSCLNGLDAASLRLPDTFRCCETRPAAVSIPVVNGLIIQHVMQCRLDELIAALRQNKPPLDGVLLAETYCCYWRPLASDEIQLLQLDELGFYAIKAVDGTRSASDVCKQLLGDHDRLTQFLTALAQIADVGVLRFIPASSR
jgi:hypothetical protein